MSTQRRRGCVFQNGIDRLCPRSSCSFDRHFFLTTQQVVQRTAPTAFDSERQATARNIVVCADVYLYLIPSQLPRRSMTQTARGTRWTARGVPPGTFAPTARCWATFARPCARRPSITPRASRGRGRWRRWSWSPGTGGRPTPAGAFSRASTKTRARGVRPWEATALPATRAPVSALCVACFFYSWARFLGASYTGGWAPRRATSTA